MVRFTMTVTHPHFGELFYQTGASTPQEADMSVPFTLITIQALLGGIDNLWHHEITSDSGSTVLLLASSRGARDCQFHQEGLDAL